MGFELAIVESVQAIIDELESKNPRQHRKVVKCLAKLEEDPRHPGLRTHRYHAVQGPKGEPVSESYVENRTARAWRVWWFYGPGRGEITVIDLGPHP